MVLLEFSVVPLGTGQSVSCEVAECVEIIRQSGLPHELHAMGTIVEGDLPAVLAVLQACVEHLAENHDRVTCTAKLDYRRGRTGGIQSKVESVRQKLDA